MIMGPEDMCPVCKWVNMPTFWAPKQEKYMCAKCIRLHNPPYMTLMKFLQGSYKALWNLEVGVYEDFGELEEIEECGWFVRSTQEMAYKIEPKVHAVVYHLEYFGSAACGRCIGYPFFEATTECLPAACEKAASPHKKRSEIQYPPRRSRYTKWMKI